MKLLLKCIIFKHLQEVKIIIFFFIPVSLRAISKETALIIREATGKNVKPGQKLCPSCRGKVNCLPAVREENIPLAALLKAPEGPQEDEMEDSDIELPQPSEIEDSDVEPVSKEDILETANESMTSLGCSPVKLHAVPKKAKTAYGKRKLDEAARNLASQVSEAVDVPVTNLTNCCKCSEWNQLIEELKTKCETATRQEKIKILTLVPDGYLKEFKDKYGITEHLIKQSRALKEAHGILSDPPEKRGRPLPDNVKQAVLAFYEDEEFSRICPGQKDCVRVKMPDGTRETKTKRLLLANLKELHMEFKKRHPDLQIGLSKFCSLRPKWCVTVDSKGMHNVCVCTTHQNMKLMVEALPVKVDYKYILGKLVCSLESRDCMIQRCPECPGLRGLESFLENMFNECDMDDDDTIEYAQWLTGGQSKLLSLKNTVSEFISAMSILADKATTHQFIVKSQSSYLRDLKTNLPAETEAIVLLDFAENYSFVCQDAIQGFHWETEQTTLHPFAVYYRPEEDGELQCISVCIVSDERDHTATTVHKFITELIPYLKQKIPRLSFIHYFSDGAGGQYKNCKNFKNLCCHEKDFGIKAKWNFFATSHGKSPCDGIGGTVKRLVRRASLQATNTNHILTPLQLYNWSRQHIYNVHFIYISSEDVASHKASTEERMSDIKTVNGSRSHHQFVPANENALKMYRLSTDELGSCMAISANAKPQVPVDQFTKGKYVCVVYDDNWYIALIEDVFPEDEDVHVRFMNRAQPSNTLSWPRRDIECDVPFAHVLCCVPVPQIMQRSGRQYKLDQATLGQIHTLFSTFVKRNA